MQELRGSSPVLLHVSTWAEACLGGESPNFRILKSRCSDHLLISSTKGVVFLVCDNEISSPNLSNKVSHVCPP